MSKKDATQTPAQTPSKFLQVSKAGDALVFKLGNGFEQVVCPMDYPVEIIDQLTFHGLEQKLRDSCAGCSKDLDYAQAEANLTSIHEGLLKGEWSRKAAGLGYRQEDVIAGLAQYKGISYDQADGTIKNAEPEKVKLAIKRDPRFAAAIAQAAADRIQKLAEKQEAATSAVDELFA